MEKYDTEGIAEVLALENWLCILNPLGIPPAFPHNDPLVFHWWMDEPQLHVLDSDGDVTHTIKQCALCDYVWEKQEMVIKRLI